MIKLIYSDQGIPINDFQAKKFIADLIAKNSQEVRVVQVCNEVVIDAMVLALMKGEIDSSQVELWYFDKPMRFCPYIGLEEPEGVQDVGVHLPMTNEILRLGMENIRNKHKAEKEAQTNG